MNDREAGDWLEELLEQTEPYIEDNGFTDAVLARLPATPHRSLSRLPIALAGLLGLVGLFTAGGSLESLSNRIGFPPEPSSALWMAVVLVIALLWIPFTIALEEE